MLRRLLPYGVYNARTHRPFPKGLAFYDPEVFDVHDKETERVVRRDGDDTVATDLDGVYGRTLRAASASGHRLWRGRYDLLLRLIPPGRGLLIDACTSAIDPSVSAAVEELGYDYKAIDLDGDGRLVERQDLTDLTLDDGVADVVVSSHTLEHIEDDEQALREIARVLVPQGLAILSVPVYFFWRPASRPVDQATDPWGHVRYYAAIDLIRKAEAAGLQILSSTFDFETGNGIVVGAKREGSPAV